MSVEQSELAAAVVVVARWRRYGHDRAYVRQGDRALGYCDLKTGTVHCDDPSHRPIITEATAELLEQARAAAYVPKHSAPEADRSSPQPAAADVRSSPQPAAAVMRSSPQPAAADVRLADVDLAGNLPGQAARAQATELRDAAPVRTFFSRIAGLKTDERAWRIGADGEAEVARRLRALGPAWRILHAVPVGDRGSDIDHVVIGPGGVFTVNAKNHPQAKVWVAGDTVTVNGFHQPYVRNSRHEARRAAALLSAAAGFDVPVHGVVAIVGAHGGLTIKEQPRDGAVSVVARKAIAAHLGARPVLLDEAAISGLYEVAGHLSTWQPKRVRRDAF